MWYITILLVAAMSLMVIFVFFFINTFFDTVVEYDIKKNISARMEDYMRFFSVTDDGQLILEEKFVYEKNNLHFLILNEQGEVLAGAYPEEFSEDIPIESYRTRKIKVGGSKYYIRDVIKKGRVSGMRIYLRAIVRTSDVSSYYKTVVSLAYLGILFIYALAVAIGVFFAKKLSISMRSMVQTAEMIGRESNISGRLAYQGYYKELKVLVEANNRMLDRMEQQIRLQEQFASDVAHELRTPVSVILVQCEYAKTHIANKEEMESAVDVVYRQSQKINIIISQLLYLSRLEQGRTQLLAEDVDLVEIVESVCEDEQEKAGNAVTICKKLEPAEAVVDINLIAIAIQNLITNAIKFSEKGGSIDVSCGKGEESVYVSVKDYGRGIPDEQIEHIFERFYKVDKSRNSQGFGLGLAITKKIMEINHGTITVESSLGKGSTFLLTLPVKN